MMPLSWAAWRLVGGGGQIRMKKKGTCFHKGNPNFFKNWASI
jgi:hypothetical protein